MANRKRIPPGNKVPLKLTPTETKAILEDLMLLEDDYEQIIRETPTGKPVMMTLDDLEDFAGYIAAEANHTEDKKLGQKLDKVFDKCQMLLATYTAEEAKRKMAKGIAGASSGEEPQTVSFRRKSKTPKSTKFPLKITQLQRETLLKDPGLKLAIRRKIEQAEEGTQVIEFTKKELNHMQDEVGQAAYYAPSPHKQRFAAVLKKVDGILNDLQLEDFGIKRPKQRRRPKDGLLIQLKVSLLDTKPVIWRRIQVEDCTLVELHSHIQAAMGWQNYHMHKFVVDGESYGTPMSDFDLEMKDGSLVKLTDFLPTTGKRFRFQYVYDFGDGWRHEILFEGYPPLDKGKKYPVCLEGERACPPEDIGGPWGYIDLLEALADPDHEQHEDDIVRGGNFDAEKFSAEQTTKAMRRELPGSEW
jgi:hypothetical protein